MTSYHGGKQRVGKKVATEISKIVGKKEHTYTGYCEPFCGMLGVYRHIPDLLGDKLQYLAGDANYSVIKMWKESQKGWVPPVKCSEIQYNRLKNQKGSSALKGFIGHQYSFGGQYFKGYAPKYGGKDSHPEASARVVDISETLQCVKFLEKEYQDFSGLKNFIIYCDPPYRDVEAHYPGDSGESEFDTEVFWAWVRFMSKNNLVIVSEYTAPKDFSAVMSTSHSSNSRGRKANGREKLWIKK